MADERQGRTRQLATVCTRGSRKSDSHEKASTVPMSLSTDFSTQSDVWTLLPKGITPVTHPRADKAVDREAGESVVALVDRRRPRLDGECVARPSEDRGLAHVVLPVAVYWRVESIQGRLRVEQKLLHFDYQRNSEQYREDSKRLLRT